MLIRTHIEVRRPWRERIIATSPVMQALLALVERVAPSSLPVLLLGETGTGKEVIARALHDASGRPGKHVSVNCAALPVALAEAELFGHRRGAFTGADQENRGLFAEAEGGTFFLDEVADLDLTVQAKLLRVLDDGGVRMVGGTAATPIRTRIVAATCRDLIAEVEAGRFREDLYYRLAGVVLTVPPLRDRPEDIPPLVARFLDDTGSRSIVPDETMIWITGELWRGNVRELRQAVHRAALLGGPTLSVADFTAGLPVPRLIVAPVGSDPWLAGRRWDEIEAALLTWAIRHYGGIRAAAVALGRPRSTVYDRVRKLGIAMPHRQ